MTSFTATDPIVRSISGSLGELPLAIMYSTPAVKTVLVVVLVTTKLL